MCKLIYWVDEDERIWSPERKLLLGLGFEVVTFGNATEAREALSSSEPSETRLLILDVMLRQGEDLITFSDRNTFKGLDTGIVLAKNLSSIESNWASKILFFSRASKPDHISRIRHVTNQIGAKYLPKNRNNQGRKFVERLRELGFLEESS